MRKINFNEPYITGLEKEYILDVFDQHRFYGSGKYTKLSTDLIKQRISSENVLLTDSCTSALEIVALLLREHGTRQEVILPSYTFSSTASAFARAGFTVVFCEIDPQSMMLDPVDVEKRITPDTIAVVAVHYGGHCCKITELKELCERHNLKLVEDAAQAFDSYLEGRALGTFGDFGCFSFHETKNIHAGLSGALTVKSDVMFRRASHIWERGTNRQEVLKGIADKYSWVEIGGSFYPTEMQAAFLYAQLQHLDENREQRRLIYEAYREGFDILGNEGKLKFPTYLEGVSSNYHAFFVLFPSEEKCDLVREYLSSHNIAAYIGYVPLHSSPVGKRMGYTSESLPLTECSAKCVLRMPFHNSLTIEDVKYVVNKVREAMELIK